MFSGTHIVAFEVTMPRLWAPDYYPSGRATVMLKEDVLDSLINGKHYVMIRFPFNINLSENQADILLDTLIRKRFIIDHVVTTSYGEWQQQYIMKRI